MKKEGRTTNYSKTGQIVSEWNFKKGKRTNYNEEGSIYQVEEYKNGELII